MDKDRQDRILKIIEVRLDNVKDVTRRSRLAFLVTTIASSAIFITIWSVYFSTARIPALYTPAELQAIKSEIAGKNGQAITSGQTITPSGPILPLHEYNRREWVKAWIESLNVSIDLLGIEININDFPFIVSLGLFIACIWLFFSFRRENRAIVSLLRDVKDDIDFPAASRVQGDDVWDIANLAFHGVANSLIFFTTGTNDKPLSQKDIFGDESKSDDLNLKDLKYDNFVARVTKLIRKIALALVFLPAITIFIIIAVDFISSYWVPSPFNPENLTPIENLERKGMSPNQINLENGFATIAGVLTFSVCLGCYIFQKRTSDSLKSFERKLKSLPISLNPTKEVISQPSESTKKDSVENTKDSDVSREPPEK